MGRKKQNNNGPVTNTGFLSGCHFKIRKDEFVLGDLIGQGGFGTIHLASRKKSTANKKSAEFVAKLENTGSGGLFSEMKVYQNLDLVSWKDKERKATLRSKGLKRLKTPVMHACSVAELSGKEYRVMVVDRLGKSVEDTLKAKKPPAATIYRLALDTLDSLEYMHEFGYAHADIKGANMCLGFTKGTEDVSYLLDFGIACPFKKGSRHIEYEIDPRKAHDGTLKFTTVDAHKGVSPARRGDLEILGYVMLQWGGELPWSKVCDSKMSDDAAKKKVTELKKKYYKCPDSGAGLSCSAAKAAAKGLCEASLGGRVPKEYGAIQKFFENVFTLSYNEEPNYDTLRKVLRAGLKASGGAASGALDFKSPKKRRSVADESDGKEIEAVGRKKKRGLPKRNPIKQRTTDDANGKEHRRQPATPKQRVSDASPHRRSPRLASLRSRHELIMRRISQSE